MFAGWMILGVASAWVRSSIRPRLPRPRAVERISEDVIVPRLDGRAYRLVRLPSGVVAMLVSDADADEAGAAVCVRAGFFDDTRQGIAHFHEHMLFLGTEKYPREDEYEEYLSSNGGSSNAYTSDEETTYYMSVNADAFEGALDRFAQFFSKPLLAIDSVRREVEAVDAEHTMSMNDDGWRLLSAFKTTVDERHPFSRFTCGSLETLLPDTVEDLHAALVEWNKVHYVGRKMRVCVVARDSLDDLERMVATCFRDVPAAETAAQSVVQEAAQVKRARADDRVEPWPSERLGRQLEVVPVREHRDVTITWPLPPREPTEDGSLPRQPPELIASHLLGHEGSTTLHSLLKNAGLIESLHCGSSHRFDDRQLFELSVELTEKGAEQRDQVTQLCWTWLKVIANSTDEELAERAAELRQLHSTRFAFSEKGPAADHATSIAEALWDHPLQPVAGPYAVGDDVDLKALRNLLTTLADPANCLVVHVDPSEVDAKEWNKEKWYGTRYRTVSLESSSSAHVDVDVSKLGLPAPNKFVPTRFELKAESGRGVYRLPSTSRRTVWRRADYADAPDSVQRSPKMVVRALLRHDLSDALTRARMRVLCAVVGNELNHDRYDARLAGLSFSFEATRAGLLITSSGFSEKVPELFKFATSALFDVAGDLDEKFDLERKEVARRCDDRSRDDPARVASAWLSRVLDAEGIAAHELAAAARSDECSLEAARRDLADALKAPLELYAAGDLDDDDAVALARMLPVDDEGPEAVAPSACLLLERGTDAAIELVALRPQDPAGPSFLRRMDDGAGEENNAARLAWQLWRSGDDDEARAEGWPDAAVRDAAGHLMGHLASPSAFQQLRTVEQLGYIADTSIDGVQGITHFYCTVQSPRLAPPAIEERMFHWLGVFRSEVEALSEDEFKERAQGLADAVAQRPASLGDVSGRDWHEISSSRRRFSIIQVRTRALKTQVTKAHVLKVIDDLLLDATHRRLLRARVYAPGEANAALNHAPDLDHHLRSLEDIAAFQQAQPRWQPAKRWDEAPSPDQPAD